MRSFYLFYIRAVHPKIKEIYDISPLYSNTLLVNVALKVWFAIPVFHNW